MAARCMLRPTTASKNSAGEWDGPFTIVTREAKDAAGDVHAWMPAFLDEDGLARSLEARGRLNGSRFTERRGRCPSASLANS